MIRHSTSPWATPTVVIIKKNGIDIRLCIDYRLVNSLTRLMVYPMPLINDLLDDLDKVLWYCSLDMASGFWVVPMPNRVRSTSAFITPFEWNQMPFRLKNAPQIYQRLLDNALYGFVKIKIDLTERTYSRGGEPDLERNESVLGRRSYIDDILVTGRSWDALWEKVEKLLDACNEWNLPISVVKSFWGRQKVDYQGHRVSAEGLETHPKDLSILQELPFPTNLRSMQSFLGSLNYYSRFIEDFAIYASVPYELREADFYETTRKARSTGVDHDNTSQDEGCNWDRAKTAFAMLKNKIVKAPIIQHFDVDRQPVVIVYASKWAISAALMQEHDGVYKPVPFTSRTLKPNEINYGMVDKEVLAMRRILDICYTQLVTRSVGTMGNIYRIVKCTRGEDEILCVIAASITPRKEVDSILISIAHRKQPRQVISMTPPTVEPGERLLVISFDGSARVKRSGRTYSGIVWSSPDWTVIVAASKYQLDLTVNETEYHGLLLADSLASAALHREGGVVISTEEERLVLVPLNRLNELLISKNDAATVKITAGTRSRKKCHPQVLEEAIVQRMKMEHIRRAQEEDKWIGDLMAYLQGNVLDLTSAEAKSYESGLLFYFPPTKQSDEDRDLVAKLVVPETLQNDLLHHYYSSLEGGHQGIGRTYHKIRAHLHWRGLYQN
ncbi:Reverse transcriptase, partial [Phytophthora palmivora]